jgi:hypothetical protein
MRPYKITSNTSKWPLELLEPLLDLAWDTAWVGKVSPVAMHPHYSVGSPHNQRYCVYGVEITHAKACRYRGRAGRSHVVLRYGYDVNTQWPVKLTYPRYKDMPVYEARNWREIIVHLAAHEFAHLAGCDGNKDGEMKCEMAAWDAIDAYRKRQDEIDDKIDQALSRRQQRAQAALQREEDRKAARNSPAYKLERLAAKEKTWLRKLRLALTKMKSIKRSRAAILRWQNKQAQLDSLRTTPAALAAKPPTL